MVQRLPLRPVPAAGGGFRMLQRPFPRGPPKLPVVFLFHSPQSRRSHGLGQVIALCQAPEVKTARAMLHLSQAFRCTLVGPAPTQSVRPNRTGFWLLSALVPKGSVRLFVHRSQGSLHRSGICRHAAERWRIEKAPLQPDIIYPVLFVDPLID